MAIELKDRSVLDLHADLPVETILNIIDVSLYLFNISSIRSRFPVVLADLLPVLGDLLCVVFNLLLSPR